jgi:hypothetical protein
VNVGDYWANKGLGKEIVRALEHELEEAFAQAGFRARRESADLVARVTAVVGGKTADLDSVTTLELIDGTDVIDRFEVRSPDGGTSLRFALYPQFAAASLTNALTRSARLLDLAPKAAPPAPPPPPPEPKRAAEPIVAAFDVIDHTGQLTGDARGQLSEYVAVRAAQILGWRMVPRETIRARIRENKAEAMQTCFDPSCQIELGKALAAEKTLATELLRIGDTCALIATVFDLRTETAERASTVKTTCETNRLLDAIDPLLRELSPAPRSGV